MVDNQDWLYDYILQFLRSPGWRVPILSFIDEHCLIFDTDEENKLVYTEIFGKFKDTIDSLLETLLAEIGVTQEQFLGVCDKGLKNPQHKRIFEQMIACDNFLSFKRLMIKRNRELEEQAVQELNKQGLATEQEVEQASRDREQAELEHAIQISKALQEEENRKQQEAARRLLEEEEEFKKALELSEQEYKNSLKRKQEEEAKKKRQGADEAERQAQALREEEARKAAEAEVAEQEKRLAAIKIEQEQLAKQRIEKEEKKAKLRIAEEEKKIHKRHEEEKKKPDLPPVQLKKQGDPSKFDVIAHAPVKEVEDLAQKAEAIAQKNAEGAGDQQVQRGETLEERQARLKRQRELILAKKKQERQEQMDEYLSIGGPDLSKKPMEPLPALVPAEELERRRNIANRLKQMSDIT